MVSIGILVTRSCICPFDCSNKGAGANHIPGLGNDGRSCASGLGEGGGRVVDVTVRILGGVEGRTLVFRQRDTIFDGQHLEKPCRLSDTTRCYAALTDH